MQWQLIDQLFPPRCAGCGQRGFRWCPQCAASVRAISPCCAICGQPESHAVAACLSCSHQRPQFDAARALGIHRGPLRNAVHRLKYDNDLGLAASFAAPLAALVRGARWQPDVLVPVPLARGRLRERGFNQAAVLGRPLAWELGIALAREALVRTRETRTQIGLTAGERRANVSGAFAAQAARVAGRVVLLLDDVMTSGATLNAGSQALRAAGAQQVFAVTLSRAAFEPEG